MEADSDRVDVRPVHCRADVEEEIRGKEGKRGDRKRFGKDAEEHASQDDWASRGKSTQKGLK